MRAVVLVCLMTLLSIPVAGLSLNEAGLCFDLGSDPSDPGWVWMASFGVYGDLAFGSRDLLRISLRVPMNRWLPQLVFDFAYLLGAPFSSEVMLSTASVPGGASAAELDLGVRAVLTDGKIWRIALATYPVGLQTVDDGLAREWAAFLTLNASADLSLRIGDRVVLGEHLRATFLESRPVGEPFFPAGEAFGPITHLTTTFGWRLHDASGRW